MADRLRVPFARPPARHRMPTSRQLHSFTDDPPEKGRASFGDVARRTIASANVIVAFLAGTALVQALIKDTEVDASFQMLTDQERHTLATKQYAACTVTHIATGAAATRGQRLRIDWRLDPDVAVNQMMQARTDDPAINFGPSVPVMRMFNMDSAGQPVISKEIGLETIDTGGRRNPDSFYATLPIPLGTVRYALSVRTSVAERMSDGSWTVAYGEQQCAELMWQRAEGAVPAHWEYTFPDPALVSLDRYAVHTLPASNKTGGS